MHYYLPIVEERRDRFMLFPSILLQSETLTALSTIWTLPIKYIFYDNNGCAMSPSHHIFENISNKDILYITPMLKIFSIKEVNMWMTYFRQNGFIICIFWFIFKPMISGGQFSWVRRSDVRNLKISEAYYRTSPRMHVIHWKEIVCVFSINVC